MVPKHNNGSRPAVIEAKGLTRELPLGKVVIHALCGVDLCIHAGEMVGVVGPSGSGKSTLLGLIGGLDSPTHGTIAIDGVDITHMSENQLAEIRNQKIGFVFQFFNLIPSLTAEENVALPIQFASHPPFKPMARARELLDMLGLADRRRHRPTELSGGEQQRVAIARALANNPPILLADEPSGNLDTAAGEMVISAFRTIRDEIGTTIVVVTHEHHIAEQMDRVLTLVDGRIVDAQGQPARSGVLC
ncbi:MAG: ABC transporter ATP-binding protein [Anaerolineae bacterium]|nr:ABC transporter ATP-binding protein [Anaerolineae bacterium]